MSYYNVPSTPSVGHSPTWYEAVNSEFYYQQTQIHEMKSNSNQQMYVNSAQIPEQMEYIENYQPLISTQFASNQTYFDENNVTMHSYAPCQGPRPWNFAQCYGFYGEPACPLVNIIDMEDFM